MVKPWADGPFKLINPPKGAEIEGISPGVVRVATEMALAHNIMLRSLNAIYLQAPNIPSHAVPAFITFCQIFVEEIHLHHQNEENILFPTLEEYVGEKGIMDANIEQHRAFDEGLGKFEKYLKGVADGIGKEGAEEFDGAKLSEIIDGFGPVVTTHLTDEIPTLLGLERFGEAVVVKAWDELEAKVLPLIKDKARVIPFGLGSLDKTFEGGKYAHWPPFPFFIPYLTRYVFWWKHRACWQFSPCTVFGKPREMPFVKEE